MTKQDWITYLNVKRTIFNVECKHIEEIIKQIEKEEESDKDEN